MQKDNDPSPNGFLNITRVYVGGISQRVQSSLDPISRSERNFTGCVQDVFVNKVRLDHDFFNIIIPGKVTEILASF